MMLSFVLSKFITKLSKLTLADFGRLCFIVSLFMVSFDIFLVIPIGFNFRAAQLIMLFPIALTLIQFMINGNFRYPVGFIFLVLWSVFIVIFIPNSDFPVRSVGYAFWLIFNLLTIFSMAQLFHKKDHVFLLMKYYIYSFVFVASFGLLQFLLSILHLGSPLVQDWWFPGVLPRINGFSYEPSYFSTYLLLGWVLLAYLLRVKSHFLNRSYQWTFFLILSLAIFLSSSRMGWMMMLLWYMQYPFLFSLKLLRGKFKKSYFNYSVILVVSGLCMLVFITMYLGLEKILFLLSGLGLFGTSAHSSGQRFNELIDTLTVFTQSPYVGYSLGGVASAIARLRGVTVTSLDDAKLNEGMSVFAEALAASGIIGFIPFSIYIASIIFKPILRRRIWTPDFKEIILSMVCALAFIFVILQFNQNILRPYLWTHIAVLSSLFYVGNKEVRMMNENNNDRC